MSGRKTKYDQLYIETLIHHMSDGNSYTSFAAKIGVHIDTLYEWEKSFPEFSEAKKRAFALSQSYWEDMGKELSRKNAAVYIFNMKNRFGWGDKADTFFNDEELIFIDARNTSM